MLDNRTQAEVIWVGLSAVKVNCVVSETPLSKSTNSGKLITDIEEKNAQVAFYKTNLVKCLPIQDEKIRYPKQSEMKSCSNHLQEEITEFKPKIVFLLGKQVADFVNERKSEGLSDNFDYKTIKRDNTVYVPVHHPSYILVYKRKQLDSYIAGISKIIAAYTYSD